MKVLVNRDGFLTSDVRSLREDMMLQCIIRDENWAVKEFQGGAGGQWSVPQPARCIIFCGGQRSLFDAQSRSNITLSPIQAGEAIHFRAIKQDHDFTSVKKSARQVAQAPLLANCYVDTRREQGSSTDGGKLKVAKKIFDANARAHKLFTFVLVYSGDPIGRDGLLMPAGRLCVGLTTLAARLSQLREWKT